MPWFKLHQVICSHGIIVCDKTVLVFDKEGFQLPISSVLRNNTKYNHMFSKTNLKQEQLECLCSEDTPTASWLPILLSHIGSRVKRRQSQSYKFKEKLLKFQVFEIWNKLYMWHTYWSGLIRCANMKWIRWVLLKIQSGNDSVHRWTDGQMDKVKPVYPPCNFGGITTMFNNVKPLVWQQPLPFIWLF